MTQAIRSTLRKLRDGAPTLADQLAPHIKTGAFCVYTPDPAHPIRWDL